MLPSGHFRQEDLQGRFVGSTHNLSARRHQAALFLAEVDAAAGGLFDSGVKMVRCGVCNRQFSNNRGLGRHSWSIHLCPAISVRWLKEHYVHQRLSAVDCGALLGLSQTAIEKALFFYRIPAHKKGHKRHQATKLWLVCVQCGAEYECSAAKLNNSRCCSSKCRDQRNGRLIQKQKIARVCEQCGRDFVVRPSDVDRRFCNHKHCYAKWRSENIKGWAVHNYSGSTLKRNDWIREYGRSWIRDCRRRDNYTCRICGTVKSKTSTGLHVHHIAPFADYEPLRSVEANGATVCADCHNWLHSNDGEPWRAAWEAEVLETLGYLPVRVDEAG